MASVQAVCWGWGEIPKLKNPGRKKRKIQREEREFIIEMHERYKLGAVALEKKIERMYGKHIPHNRMYKILLERGKIVRNERKRKQRKMMDDS